MRIGTRDSGPLLFLIYGIGLIGVALPAARRLTVFLTPFVLFITSAYVLSATFLLMQRGKRSVLAFWGASVFIISMLFEGLGVRYGLFFGEYSYTRILGPGMAGVPLIIGLKWVTVVFGAYCLAGKVSDNPVVTVAGTAAAALVFDIVMEPVAVFTGFWVWHDGIPFKNYVTWFLLSAVFASGLRAFGIKTVSGEPVKLFMAQFLFFLSLRALLFSGLIG